MTPEQIRIAIAEKLGYEQCPSPNCEWSEVQHLHKDGRVFFPESYSTSRYPDGPNDLNAVHEVEETVLASEDTGYSYECHLMDVTGAYDKVAGGLVNYMKMWHATALQRCEALLRTWGLWKEDKSPKCARCGTPLILTGCPVCGAPQCCPKCCEEAMKEAKGVANVTHMHMGEDKCK